jgi:hypothetical protein
MRRSSMVLEEEARKVYIFVKAAPKNGRRYVDMLKKVYDIRGGITKFGGCFDTWVDRNLINSIMPRLKNYGVYKCVDGRYRVSAQRAN